MSDKKSTKKPRGKKRSLSGPDNEDDDTPTSKRREKEDVVATPPSKRRDKEDTVAIVPSKRREKEDVAVVTPLKTPTKVVAQNVAAATKSPVGVNRRNAVLFTRKKQAAVVLTPEPRDDDSDLENKETEVQSPGKDFFLLQFKTNSFGLKAQNQPESYNLVIFLINNIVPKTDCSVEYF